MVRPEKKAFLSVPELQEAIREVAGRSSSEESLNYGLAMELGLWASFIELWTPRTPEDWNRLLFRKECGWLMAEGDAGIFRLRVHDSNGVELTF